MFHFLSASFFSSSSISAQGLGSGLEEEKLSEIYVYVPYKDKIKPHPKIMFFTE